MSLSESPSNDSAFELETANGLPDLEILWRITHLKANSLFDRFDPKQKYFSGPVKTP